MGVTDDVTIILRARDFASSVVMRLIKLLQGIGATMLGMPFKLFQRAFVAGLTAPLAILDSILSRIFSIRTALMGVLTAAIVSTFSEFEKGTAAVYTLTDKTRFSLEDVRETSILLNRDLAHGFADTNKALLELVSSGIDFGDSANFLRASSDLAVGGMAELKDAALLLIKTMAAYSMEAGEASRVADVMFQTVDEGITTVTELANTMGRLTPVAAEAGLSIEELFAGMGTLTRVLRADEAATAFRQMLTDLIKADDAAKSLGISVERIKEVGFLKFIQQLTVQRQKGLNLSEYIEDIRGLLGAFIFTSNSAAELTSQMEKMGNSMGKAKDAAEIMRDTLDFRMRRVLAAIQILFVRIGEAGEEEMKAVADAIFDTLVELETLMPGIEAVVREVVAAGADIVEMFASASREGKLPETLAAIYHAALDITVSFIVQFSRVILTGMAEAGRTGGIAFTEALLQALQVQSSEIVLQGGPAGLVFDKLLGDRFPQKARDAVAEIKRIRAEIDQTVKLVQSTGGGQLGIFTMTNDENVFAGRKLLDLQNQLKVAEAQLRDSFSTPLAASLRGSASNLASVGADAATTFFNGFQERFKQLAQELPANQGALLQSAMDRLANLKNVFNAAMDAAREAKLVGAESKDANISNLRDMASLLAEIDVAMEAVENKTKRISQLAIGQQALLQGIGGLSNGIAQFFTMLADKSTTAADRMRAFGSVIASTLSSIGSLFLQYAILSGLKGTGWGMFSFIGNLPGFSNSARGTPMREGSFTAARKFGTGGVSRGPTLGLIGEGGYPAEAVIPLPDGRNVPVRMHGQAGSTMVVIPIYAMDGTDVQRVLERNAETVQGIVLRGAQRSPNFGRALGARTKRGTR